MTFINFIFGWRKLILVALLLIGFGAAFYLRQTQSPYLSPENAVMVIKSFPVAAPLLFVLFYVFSAVFLLPTLPFNIIAGFLWGPLWGGLITLFSFSLGASIPFFIARQLAFGRFNGKLLNGRLWSFLHKEIQRNDWKIVAFTRINPVFPSVLLNYFYGLTSISFKKYFWATMVFISPLVFLFAYAGSLIGDLVLKGGSFDFTANVFAISFAVSFIVILGLILKRYLQQRSR